MMQPGHAVWSLDGVFAKLIFGQSVLKPINHILLL